MISFTLEDELFGKMGHGTKVNGRMMFNKGMAAITC